MPILYLQIILALTLGGFGSWKILRHQRHAIETQFELDQSTGSSALDLRDLQNRLSRGNLRIKAVRSAIIAAMALAQASAVEAGRASLKAIAWQQDAEVLRWLAHWSALKLQGVHIHSLSGEEITFFRGWERLPPDAVGEQELRWQESDVVIFEKRKGNHRSEASAFRRANHWSATFL